MEKRNELTAEPKISIITAVKNGEKCIERTIQSVIKQTYLNIEFIIVDGYSTDNTYNIIKCYSHNIDILVREPDKSLFDGMNKGIKLATGDYINFLNCGDYFVEENTIERIFSHMDPPFSDDFIYGNILLSDGAGRTIKEVQALELTIDNLIKEGTRTLCHQTAFVKKSILPAYNLKFKIISDLNWYFDILNRNSCLRFRHTNNAIVAYSIGGISSKRFLRSMLERFIIVYNQLGFSVLIKNLPFMFKPLLYKVLSSCKLKRFPSI